MCPSHATCGRDITTAPEFGGAGAEGGRSLSIKDSTSSNLFNAAPLTQEVSPLFKLPIELRVHIYELVLSLQPPATRIIWTALNSQDRQCSVLSLLETCRRVWAEAEPIFYSINRLEYSTDRTGRSFLSGIGPRRRNAITALSIEVPFAGAVLQGVEELHLAPRLKSLHIIRTNSIRFTGLLSWRLLARQINTALEGLAKLEDVKMIMPEPKKPISKEERDRQRNLDAIDATFRETVSKRKASASSILNDLLPHEEEYVTVQMSFP